MFSQKANKKNNLGFFMHDSKLYSLLGFFHQSSYAESDHKKVDGLPYNVSYIKEHNFSDQFGHWTPISNDKQLRNFDLNPKDHLVLLGYNSCSFVFSRYKKEIPFTELKNVTKDFRQALFDYVEANGIIKLIATPHRIIKAIKNKEIGKETTYNHFVDKEILIRAFDKVFHKASYGNGLDTDKLDNSIYPEGYNKSEEESVDKKFIDAYSHKERVIKDNTKTSAIYKGGSVILNYLSQDYNIPLLPLMAWFNKNTSETYDFYLWTWIFDEKVSGLETLILGSELDKKFINELPKELNNLFFNLASTIKESDYESND